MIEAVSRGERCEWILILSTPLAGIKACIVCGSTLVRFHGLQRITTGLQLPVAPLYWCEGDKPSH